MFTKRLPEKPHQGLSSASLDSSHFFQISARHASWSSCPQHLTLQPSLFCLMGNQKPPANIPTPYRNTRAYILYTQSKLIHSLRISLFYYTVKIRNYNSSETRYTNKYSEAFLLFLFPVSDVTF